MERNDDQSKGPSPSQIFCERVTVAGLEDLYTAKLPPALFLFALGMVLSTMFGLFTSFQTIQHTLHATASVNIRFKDKGDMLYPNVTICTTAVINRTAIREMMVVPKEVEEKLKVSDLDSALWKDLCLNRTIMLVQPITITFMVNTAHIGLFLQEMGADRKQFMEDIIQLMSLSLIQRPINQSHLRYINAVFTATAATLSHEEASIFEILPRSMPPCNLTLSNCTFDGTPIDCCTRGVLGRNDGYVCYGVPLSTIQRDPEPFSRPIVFNVDVRMDWVHIPWVRGEDALDGFLVIVSEPFTTTNTAPVAVAPGWHGTIKLTRIRQRTDRTDCIQREKLPNLNYVSYYDQDGKNCEMEIGLDLVQNALQCTAPLATYFPNNAEQCSFQQTYAAEQFVIGALDDTDMSPLMKHKLAEMAPVLRKRLGSLTRRCKPICQRWQYEPIVGYSELRDNHGRTTDANANISWSRITVTIPSEYYQEQLEEERSGVYVIFCNVGGAMGVCLGLSAVTLVQMVVFGLHSCYIFKLNRNRIQPS